MPGAARRALVIAVCVTYVLLFHYSYINLISPLYSYDGMYYNPAPLPYLVPLFVYSIAPAFWMPIDIRRPTQMAYWFLYLIVLIPICIVPLYARPFDSLQIVMNTTIVFAGFALLGFTHRLPLLSIPRLPIGEPVYWAIVAAMSLSLLAVIVGTFGLRFHLPSLYDVYDVRSEFTDTLASGGRLAGYAVIWQGNVFSPLFFAAGIMRRRPVFFAAGALNLLFIYSITGYKSTFFTLILIPAALLALRGNGRSFGLRVPIGVMGVMLLCIALLQVFDLVIVGGVMLQRLFATPGLLSGYYFEFFSRNPQMHLFHSFLRFAGTPPFRSEPDALIGMNYYGNPQVHANANFWADAFANFGNPGIIGFTLALIVIFWVYDSLARTRGMVFSCLMLAVPAISICNSGLQTVMMTHGLGLIILLLWLMPPDPVLNGAARKLRNGIHIRPPAKPSPGVA